MSFEMLIIREDGNAAHIRLKRIRGALITGHAPRRGLNPATALRAAGPRRLRCDPLYVARIERSPAPIIANFATWIATGQVRLTKEGGRFAGFVVAYARGDFLHVENMASTPPMQGRGGRRLLDWAETTARKGGMCGIELYGNMTENIYVYQHIEMSRLIERLKMGFRKFIIASSCPKVSCA